MRTKLLTVAVLASVMVAGCIGGTMHGSGTVVTEERSVGGFDHVSVSGMAQIALVRGDAAGVSVRADDNLVEHIVTETRGGTLHIGWTPRAATATLRPSEPVVLNVTYEELSGLSLSGTAFVDIAELEAEFFEISVSGSGVILARDVDLGQLRTAISGSGTVTPTGTAGSQSVDISGSGRYSGRDLATKDARISVSGSGVVDVNAEETLSVMISGSGTVRYAGDPSLDESITGTGTLRRVE